MEAGMKMVTYHQLTAKPFEGDYKPQHKEIKAANVVRSFDRASSVFKDWKLSSKKKAEEGFW